MPAPLGSANIIHRRVRRTSFGPVSIPTVTPRRLLADEIARTVISPAELRVGIITSFIGAPFFLFLLLRHNRRVTSL